MGMQRMFTLVCDACLETADNSEWYADTARRTGRRDGWAVSGNRAVCPTCREAGHTLSSVTAFGIQVPKP